MSALIYIHLQVRLNAAHVFNRKIDLRIASFRVCSDVYQVLSIAVYGHEADYLLRRGAMFRRNNVNH